MRKFYDLMKQGVVGAFYLGLVAYGIFLVATYFGNWKTGAALVEKFQPIYVVGLPVCGITAFAIVCVLEQLAAPSSEASNKLEFKAFGLTFSGPAGPVTLWIVCYLTLVASIHLMDDEKKKEPNKAPEPTSGTVTVPANAGPAPFTSAAHLGR